jgi:hypothetical protein
LARRGLKLKLIQIHPSFYRQINIIVISLTSFFSQLLLEISSFTEKIGQEHNEFARLGKDKVGMFVRTFENLYLEFLIDHGRSAERV